MKITEQKVKLSEIVDGFVDGGDEGVVGYGGRLNIRPAYQREFIYKGEQKAEVVRTILKGFPLNTIYWSVTGDGNYELLDGQQRIMSACTYVGGSYSVKSKSLPKPDAPFYFHNLPLDIRQRILDYEFTVYVCSGSQSEKLEWFEVINIAGETLTDQELRNAMYAGPWLSDAKKDFSSPSARAQKKGHGYLKGQRERQDYLETVLKWISDRDGCGIAEYMSAHQHDTNANALWLYFSSVIDWAQELFPFAGKEKKGVQWGILHNRYSDTLNPDPAELRAEYDKCMKSPEVGNKTGIFEYLMSGDPKTLSIRKFDESDKETAYAECGGKCAHCGKVFEIGEMEADHIVPWSKGGRTEYSNLQMLCKECNRRKGNR